MTERIDKLKKCLDTGKTQLCLERGRLLTESYKQTDGEPPVWRWAKAFANVLNNVSIFIEDDELIVGNASSKPGGIEIAGTFSDKHIEACRRDGWTIDEEDVPEIKSIHEYWRGRAIFDMISRRILDNKLLAAYDECGIKSPAPRNRTIGEIRMAGYGWNLGRETGCIPDFEKVLNYGTNSLIEEAENELQNTRVLNADAFEKVDFLKSAIISLKAINNFAVRFSYLAKELAAKEKNETRKKELQKISEICGWVPANPARNFYEAIQSYWFIVLTVLGTNAFFGRFDQLLYPFYKNDLENGKISEAEALELLQCLRIKTMHLNSRQVTVEGSEVKWDSMVIGGLTPDGHDATNDLTFLTLEAAKLCPTPHPPLLLRVHGGTPDALMQKAMELLKAGVNMPSFLGDHCAINFLTTNGLPISVARDYATVCAVEISPVGRSRFFQASQFIIPLILEFFLNNGVEPRTSRQLGPKIDVESYTSFEKFVEAFKKFTEYFMELGAEVRNVETATQREQFPDPPASALSYNGIKEGKDVFNRKMQFENGVGINAVAMVNLADSLAAIKKLVFEEKKISLKKLRDALAANWKGYEDIRKLCLEAPKYGNNDDYVDSIAKEFYKFFADTTSSFETVFKGRMIPFAISMSRWRHSEGGQYVGATPDGRYSGEGLADEGLSPMPGMDKQGLKAVFESALKVDQVPFHSIPLGLNLHPDLINSVEGSKKVSNLIKDYVIRGGRYVQLNVVSRDMLIDAQKNPAKYPELLVNVATNHWAFFVQLNKEMQDRLIQRTEYRQL